MIRYSNHAEEKNLPRLRNTDLRNLPDHWFDSLGPVPDWFRQQAESRLIPRLGIPGRKDKAGKRGTLVRQLHALVITGVHGHCVSDTRDTTSSEVRTRAKLWDCLKAERLARECGGSKVGGFLTRYAAFPGLLDEVATWPSGPLTDDHLERNTQMRIPTNRALVVLQDRDDDDPSRKKVLPLPREPRMLFRQLQAIEDRIDRINDAMLDHTWKCYRTDLYGKRWPFQPRICIRQVHSRELFRAARLYGSGPDSAQNIPRHERRNLLIDGELTTELDYSGMQLRMVYHLSGIDPDKEAYAPMRVFPKAYKSCVVSESDRRLLRDLVKAVTLRCLNVASRPNAHSAVGQFLAEYDGVYRPRLHFLVYKVEGTDPIDLVSRIVAAHPQVADQFFRQRGPELMTIDGALMLDILESFALAKKPAVGIHDAVVCRRSDREFALNKMTTLYRAKMATLFREQYGIEPAINFDPIIRVEF